MHAVLTLAGFNITLNKGDFLLFRFCDSYIPGSMRVSHALRCFTLASMHYPLEALPMTIAISPRVATSYSTECHS